MTNETIRFVAGCVCALILALSLIAYGNAWSRRDQNNQTRVKVACINAGGSPTGDLGCVR